MSLTLSLTDGTTSYDLSSASTLFQTRENGITWQQAGQLTTRTGARFSDGQLPAFLWHDNAALIIKGIWHGTSQDALKDAVHNVNLMIQRGILWYTSMGSRGAKCTLQSNLNGTNLTEWTIIEGVADPGPWANAAAALLTTPFLSAGEIRLVVSPFSAETADVTNTFSSPYGNDGASATTGTIRGDVVDFPAKFVLSPAQDLNNGHCWIIRRTRGTVANFQYLLEAEAGAAGSYTATNIADVVVATYSTQASAAASAGNFGRWANNGVNANPQVIAREAITANLSDHYGQFHVWMRHKRGDLTNGSTAWVFQLKYGTKNSPTNALNTVAATITDGNWHMTDLGVITWPDVLVPASATVASLVFELYSNFPDTHSTLDVDYFLLVPCDDGFLDIDFPATTLPNGYQVVIDGTSNPPSIYVTDGSGNVQSALTSLANGNRTGAIPKLGAGTSRWLLYCDNRNSDVLADSFSFTLTHRPVYHWLRGT